MTTAAPAPRGQPRTFRPLTPTDEAMVISCARYQYVTIAQWCRSYEAPGKERYLQRRSRELVARSYLSRLYLARPGGAGKAPSIFTIGPAGRRHTASLGWRTPRRFRPGDAVSLSPQHLAHSEAITDVLLSFDLLARHEARLQIADMLHERFLHEQRFRVPVRTAHPVTGEILTSSPEVIPDAFVRVVGQVGGTMRRFPLLIEVDRDTERQTAFREKIARLYAFGTSESYERVYAARTFTAAFFLRTPRRDPLARLAEVLDWTERELRQQHLEHEADAFRFCVLDPATTAPSELLLADHWVAPFNTTPQPLLDLAVPTEGGV